MRFDFIDTVSEIAKAVAMLFRKEREWTMTDDDVKHHSWWLMYAESYLQAFESVSWDTDWDTNRGFKTFPAFFLLRHTLELYLKTCLAMADSLGGKSAPKATHQLWMLADRLDNGVPGVLLARVKRFIKRVDAIDHGSFAFRYPAESDFSRWSSGPKNTRTAMNLMDHALEHIDDIRDLPKRTRTKLDGPAARRRAAKA